MKIIKIANYDSSTICRAQKALDIILTMPHLIGQREFDSCFEMGDGKEVITLIFNCFIVNNITFDKLPWETQSRLGQKWWDKYTEITSKIMNNQLTLF